ncbi:MAG TPA: NAD(P)/FAD-dependent oxidoreductase [Steroidobacteraceae bacterium]|nr:NAD(P)/FAD-dependent oxidoreductase [Steroidobacteraceae bacterium]
MSTTQESLPMAGKPGRSRVVIVGCGFGGLFCARELKGAPVELVVVDRNNYHLFQPLLYQVASAALAPADIAQPIRTILRGQTNAFVMLGEVERVALDRQCIFVNGAEVSYDYLVLAPGAVDNYFGHHEWARHAPGMKEVEDATLIRSRLLMSFEAAELENNDAERVAYLSFVIVGGGPTGVELAGAIKELAVDVIPRDFHVADTRRARVILIEAGPRLLPAFEPASSERALKQLQALGVEVWLGKRVTDIQQDGVVVDGQKLTSHNVIWAAGVRPAPLVETLGAELGPGARVKVQPDCSIPGHPNVFVIGDAAYLVDSKTAKQVPGVSQGALQMGRYVADIIREEQAPATRGVMPNPRPSATRARGFHYRDYGSMATVGKSRAVVEIGPFKFGGLLAWFAWLALHITVLIGFRNRISVLVSWIYGYVFFRRGSRLITRSYDKAGRPVPVPLNSATDNPKQ